MWANLQKIFQKRLFQAFWRRFWQGRRLENQISKKIGSFSLYVSVSVKFHVKPMNISEDTGMLTMIHLTNFFYGTLVNGFGTHWTPPPPHHPHHSLLEARCHFAINFTTRFQKLHIMRDSKTPVEQTPSLGGTNPSKNLA